jgi:hypothetical protein
MSGSQISEYLNQWHTDRDNWKFKKLVQQEILDNMYDSKVLSKSEFAIAVLYLKGIQGIARERMVQDAKNRVKEFERKQEAEEEVDESERRAVKRAIKLLETLDLSLD